MRFTKVIIELLLITILFPQIDKGKEQSQPVPKKSNDGFIFERSKQKSHIQEIINSGKIASYDQQNNYSVEKGIEEDDIMIEPEMSVSSRHYNPNRSVNDTLAYYPASGSWSSQFIMSPGDAMLMTFKMPTDGIIKGINIPVYEWGTGDQELTVSLHKLQYPHDINGNEYSMGIVDGNGWIGGYDMDSTGIHISGDIYTPGGAKGVCDSNDTVYPYITDPLLASELGVGPPNVPPQGVVWPDSDHAVIMTPQTYPDFAISGNQNNWINLQEFGVEHEFQTNDWIGLLFQFTGQGDGSTDEPVGFFYGYGDGLVDPWRFLKFYGKCGGTSGNGGWHIRHWLIRTELAVELTGDRGPVFREVSELNTAISTESRTVTAHITDDNPSGGDVGVASAQIIYQLDSLTAQLNTIEMTLISGDNQDGIWGGDIPGQEFGMFVYWKLRAVDINGNVAEFESQAYYIFQPTFNELIFLNQNIDYGIGLPLGFDIIRLYFYWDNHNFDVWPAWNGPLTDALLEQYDVLIELTNGNGPIYNNDDEVKNWWGRDKTYIVSGDEWLGSRSGWKDGPTEEGSVAKSILGIAYQYNDINYTDSGDQEGISRLMSDSTGVTSVLYEFLSDSLLLNYDPDYETGNYNWLDGFEVVDGYTIDMTAYSGILDSNGNIPVDAEIYNVMVHGQAGNGGKSAFMSFDPIALNTTPGYHWIGASSYWNLSHPNCPPNASPLVSVYEALQDIVSVEDVREQPTTFSLKGNYPNPFNPATNIQFELTQNAHVTLTIYDLLGMEVKALVSGELVSGDHQVIWDGTNDFGISVSAGVYFYQLRADDYGQTKKMIFLK